MKYNRWGRNPTKMRSSLNSSQTLCSLCHLRRRASCSILQELEKHDALKTRLLSFGETMDGTLVSTRFGANIHYLKSRFDHRSSSVYQEHGMAKLPAITQQIVETVDVFPTLCDAANLPVPKFCVGNSLLPVVRQGENETNPNAGVAVGYFRSAKTIRTDRYRMILHKDGFVELYDRNSDPGETKNVAETNSKVIAELTAALNSRLSPANRKD